MDPFGGSTGGVDDLSSQGLKNGFNDIPQNDVQTLIDANRVKPNQVQSGVQRGTQRIVSNDGSYITLGEIPNTNGEFGIAFFDSEGNLTSKQLGVSLTFTDGTVTTTITAGTIVQNDGTNDRLFMGNE